MKYLEVFSNLTGVAYAEYVKLSEAGESGDSAGALMTPKDIFFYYRYIRKYFKRDLKKAVREAKRADKRDKKTGIDAQTVPPPQAPPLSGVIVPAGGQILTDTS